MCFSGHSSHSLVLTLTHTLPTRHTPTQCLAELSRVQKQLHRAQDVVARLEPAALPVLELQQRQREWDEAHAAAGELGAFARLGALRKLGARPTLIL